MLPGDARVVCRGKGGAGVGRWGGGLEQVGSYLFHRPLAPIYRGLLPFLTPLSLLHQALFLLSALFYHFLPSSTPSVLLPTSTPLPVPLLPPYPSTAA